MNTTFADLGVPSAIAADLDQRGISEPFPIQIATIPDALAGRDLCGKAPTGSGKTTILDGMCFALFGDSSGGERDGRQMRSHHAGLDTLTEVRFDFALGTDRYRVRRVPEQVRRALVRGPMFWRGQTHVPSPGPQLRSARD